ncbi:nuclear pore complex protein NUP43 [Nicotiana tabacum]|uniref:Nuclear pore complex protein NUP43 n=2 Tax=Nicotiana TaxID=4085 RepID=A0A1S4A3L7_TOBAC|nr:PREDICTED: guanine nucleotide-binding protein subunit beta-like protein [Nicotiana sylvestris]XP_016471179.1 PREDICTED: nuclear pore complex protein NUP43-like [Nicotiana tabacum]
MAVITSSSSSQQLQVHRFPQNNYIDSLGFLPQLSSFHRHILLATFNSDSSNSSLQLLNLTQKTSNSDSNSPEITLQSSLTTPSRISSLKTSQNPNKPLIAASTFSGDLLVYKADLVNGSLDFLNSVKGFHSGRVAGIDVSENGSEFVSVGEDGRINLVSFVNGGLSSKRVFDGNGLVSYGAVKWASPVEFVSGGLGFGLQWWDQRRPGGPVSQFKGNWTHGSTSGIVHSIDIHPSRKHTCLAGGSSGTVFAWDLRWQQQPIILAGVGTSDLSALSPSESDVWEVHYDNYTTSSNYRNISESRVLPAMICSEDGILAVIEQGEEPVELLAEPCAINSFDIDRQNPSDIVCSLEWESIAILTRS